MARWWSDLRCRGPTAPRAVSLAVALFQTRAPCFLEHTDLFTGQSHLYGVLQPTRDQPDIYALPSAFSGATLFRRVIPTRPPILCLVANQWPTPSRHAQAATTGVTGGTSITTKWLHVLISRYLVMWTPPESSCIRLLEGIVHVHLILTSQGLSSPCTLPN
jgi:hypothetical protein